MKNISEFQMIYKIDTIRITITQMKVLFWTFDSNNFNATLHTDKGDVECIDYNNEWLISDSFIYEKLEDASNFLYTTMIDRKYITDGKNIPKKYQQNFHMFMDEYPHYFL